MRLKMTCAAVPEQYDVLDDDGKICGYIRLRYGSLTVESCKGHYVDAPAESVTLVYSHEWDDEWKGGFDSDEERKFHLDAALAALAEHYEVQP